MTDPLDRGYAPSPDAYFNAVGDETVLLHLKRGEYFGLNPVGSQIWAGLNQGRLPSAICAALAEEFDVGLDVIEADARRLLDELIESELLVPAS